MRGGQMLLRVIVVGFVASLGACSDSTASRPSNDAKIKAMEEKIVQVEDNYRELVASRDEMKKKLLVVESDNARLSSTNKQLSEQVAAQESLLKSRTEERDFLSVNYADFRVSLKNLLEKAEEAVRKNQEKSNLPESPKVPVIPVRLLDDQDRPIEPAIPTVPTLPLPEKPEGN
ncbi:MAG: hypothetical protein R3B84_11170 [Zavarzinella sp.]